MSWTDPRTWTTETMTSALLNTHLRDNLNAVSRIIDRNVSTTTLTNSTTQTTVYSYVVPANTLSTNRILRLTWIVPFVSVTGVGAQTLRLRVKFGTTGSETTFADSTALSYADNSTYAIAISAVLAAANGTSAQLTSTHMRAISTGGTANLAAPLHNIFGGFPLTIDQTADRTLLISALFGAASTSLQLGAGVAITEVLP